MRLISRDKLKKKLDEKHDFKLVMTLSHLHYKAKHIPESIHIDTPEKAKKILKLDDEIVVYCSDINCSSSQIMYHALVENGCTNVCRYAGGISDWEEAGFPLGP